MKLKLTILLCLLSYFSHGQCDAIKKKVDKFSGNTAYSSPSTMSVLLGKIVDGGDKEYYILLNTSSNSIESGSGITILLKNNIKIIRQKKVDVDYLESSGTYLYTVGFTLTLEEIKLIRDNPITNFKLYIFEQSITSAEQKQISEYAKCLLLL